jgi:hypothetical protein
MHFAIDQKPVTTSHNQDTPTPTAVVANSGVSPSFAEEILLFGKPVRTLGVKFGSTGVGVYITDIYRKDDQLFIRYTIDNRTTRPYAAGQPEVFMLKSAHSRTSLHTLRYSQVGQDVESRIRSDGLIRMSTVDCDVPSEPIPSDQRVSGILLVHMPVPLSETAVLRLVFPSDGHDRIAVTVVL